MDEYFCESKIFQQNWVIDWVDDDEKEYSVFQDIAFIFKWCVILNLINYQVRVYKKM